MAPGMALMFLMFTATNGGRTLLTERTQGTLPRLLISPTTSAQVLGGKTTGIYLTGVAQMLILIIASALLFQLRWGAPFAVLVLILAAVAGAVGWGMLITALAKTPGQVSTIGSAVTLIFGILGGSFVSTGNLPEWFQTLSKITPNAWGLEGFTILALGGSLADILVPVAALLVMGATLFTVAVLLLNRPGWPSHDGGHRMKKILAIIRKDIRLRFAGPSEWLFFLILPVAFTLILAGGTAGAGDARIRLLVVDQAQTPLSAELIAALGKSEAIRPEVRSYATAEREFSQRSASAVLIIPANSTFRN